MKKQADLMNQYVADLAVLNTKFHNLHWNVKGPNFEQVHVYIERVYDEIFLKYDEAAERLKMIGNFPVGSLKKYLEITNVSEIEDKDYDVKEALTILLADLLALKEQVVLIRKEAESNDDFITVSLMEDHITVYDKEIWFTRQTLK